MIKPHPVTPYKLKQLNKWIKFYVRQILFSTDPSLSSSYKFWEFIFTLLDLWSLFLEKLLTILQTFGQVFLCISNSNWPIIKLNLYSYDCTGLLVFGLVHATESLPCSLFFKFWSRTGNCHYADKEVENGVLYLKTHSKNRKDYTLFYIKLQADNSKY